MHNMHAQRSLAALVAGSLVGASLVNAEEPDALPTPPAPAEQTPLADTPEPSAGVPLSASNTSTPALPPPSQNMAVNLVVLLVKKGQLTQEEGLALIQQAEAEAQTAKAQAAYPSTDVLPPLPADDGVRVAYVPQTVRNSIRDEVKQELMAEAREGKFAGAVTAPEDSKFRIFGDFRGRYESLTFGDANDNTGSFPNFQAINTGAPFDITGTEFSPQHNVDQDRQRARLRARFGADITLDDGFTAGLRLATGDNNGPTTPNQTLGANGGNFSKYAIWLDRAFLGYDLIREDDQELTLQLGRFDNPFFTTSDVMWDDDLGFDGLALRGKQRLNDDFVIFGAGGLFPVFNTDLNFASNQPAKFESRDKWLYGVQGGVEWKVNEDLTAKVGIAYYDFRNVEGELSSPFVPLSPNDAGDTDSSRPAFAQRGNSYMALRDITPTAANDFGNIHQYQYYGLATPFRVLSTNARLDYDGFDSIKLALTGDLIKNLAFDESALAANAVNNRRNGAFDGGDTAWALAFQFGNNFGLAEAGDWTAGFGYRYVESDAVVDGFADSEFGGGGTNVQGFTISGTMAVTPSVRVGLRWMSSNEIAGPPLSADTLQFDINAKF